MSFRTFVRTLTVLLLMLALNGCGGGSGSGFNANESWGIQIEVLPQQTVPVNLLGWDPCLSIDCFNTVEVNVIVTDHLGNPVPQGTDVALDMSTVGHGYLTRLDDPETEDINEFTGRDDDGNIVARMGQGVAPTSGGIAKFFFTSNENPGDVRLTASVTAPTGAVVSRRTTLTVGTGTGGLPTQVLLAFSDGDVLFTQDVNAVPKQTRGVALVTDEKGFGVADPEEGDNNVLVEIIAGPGAGEHLIGENANGERMGGSALLLPTEDGKAVFTVVSGNQPGLVVLRATADGDDNNVDDVILQPVVNHADILVTSTGLNPTLQILTTELPDGNFGDSYAAQLQASQGVPPYNWLVIGGQLPPGLALDPNTGVIQGFQTNFPGNYCFLVQVTDSTTPQPEQASRALCINIDGERPPSTLQIRQSTFNLPAACAGESYAQTLGATGGTPPYSWTLDYTPPAGATDWLELSGSGVLFGTPVDPDDIGIFNLGITVSDDGNQEAIGTIQLEVLPSGSCP
ncbi:Ig domain-containing protein [Thioalkalivibrio thiocyanodenitrificans]|uniref:Ig domain-containing protein n=1 Tax=Thioalkalivibrio thiocyanodenitrificans TaxID=243063 RepID=UPI0003A64369|nr:Ig domain-containing protein [Thioalkalivibrio thiocyanodenitrificans]